MNNQIQKNCAMNSDGKNNLPTGAFHFVISIQDGNSAQAIFADSNKFQGKISINIQDNIR
jgi:hypothetical protein